MMDSSLYGTLDALILKTLSDRPRHGYGIARYLEDALREAARIEEGSLYPALYRLERRGLDRVRHRRVPRPGASVRPGR